MWDWLMWLLADAEIGTFELRDWVNVVIAGVGLYLAYVATKIAAKQDAMSEAEKARKADLEIEIVEAQSRANQTKLLVCINNDGDRAARDFRLRLLVPETVTFQE